MDPYLHDGEVREADGDGAHRCPVALLSSAVGLSLGPTRARVVADGVRMPHQNCAANVGGAHTRAADLPNHLGPSVCASACVARFEWATPRTRNGRLRICRFVLPVHAVVSGVFTLTPHCRVLACKKLS